LDDAMGLDRRGQLLQRLGIHGFPGLVRVSLQIDDGELIKLTFFISLLHRVNLL
jgi:hypothetical protein